MENLEEVYRAYDAAERLLDQDAYFAYHGYGKRPPEVLEVIAKTLECRTLRRFNDRRRKFGEIDPEAEAEEKTLRLEAGRSYLAWKSLAAKG